MSTKFEKYTYSLFREGNSKMKDHCTKTVKVVFVVVNCVLFLSAFFCYLIFALFYMVVNCVLFLSAIFCFLIFALFYMV